MKREPDMDSAAYRDKKINEEYQQRINPKRPTEGELLNKEGVGEDGGFIDDGTLDTEGNVQAISIEDIESDIVKQKQLRDAQENQEFDKTVAGGTLEDLRKGVDIRNNPKPTTNYITAEQLNDAPMKTTDPFGDVLTLAASNYLVRRPGQVGSLALDLAFPDVEGVKFEQWTRLNPQVHMAVKGTQIAAIKGKQYLSKQKEYWSNVIDYLTNPNPNIGLKEINSHQAGGLTRVSAEGIPIDPLYSTFLESRKINDGDLRPDFTSPVNPNARIGNLGGRGFKEKSELIRDGSQTTRMEKAFDENKKLIGKEHIDNTIGAKKQLSEIDKFAKVTKPKLRKYVEQFGGSAVDLEEIFKEYTTKHTSALNAKAWLNQYWKDLNKGVGKGGLKNARLKIVDGELKIVGGSTKHSIEHPFELDHSKAKELMHKLGLEGADMSDNLDIVYTEWNRAKNNIGNPAVPDEILEAIGQSTTLENFVRRRLDETFMLSGERVPQRFKEAAKTRMMDNALDMKPGEKLSDIVEIELKFWDEYSNLLTEIDDYVPTQVQRQLDAQTNLTPQEYLQQLKDMGVYDNLTRTLKNKYERLSQQWIERSRGYGANEASKRARFYGDRSDG
jgi:hypothetical protein